MALADAETNDTIAEDWKAILAKHQPEEIEADPVKEEAAPEPVEPVQEEGRARDESGRFIRSKGKDDPGVTVEPEKAPAPTSIPEALPAPQPETAARDVSKPPSSWKPAARAEWAKISPAIQVEIHRRETDFLTAQRELMPEAQFGNAMKEVIEPYRMLIEAEGGTPERAVASLLQTAAIFRVGTPQQKYDAVMGIARQYGVNLNLPANPNVPPQGEYRDSRVDQILQHLQTERTRQTQAEEQQLEGIVTQWMNANENGQPKYPYLGDVINDMSVLIPQIRQANPLLTPAQTLEQAYERAIWASPDIRPLLQKAQQEAATAQHRAESQQKVAEARRAASVNVPRRASSPSPGKPGKLEDTIAETARALGLIQ